MRLKLLPADLAGPPIYYEDLCAEPKSPLRSCRIDSSRSKAAHEELSTRGGSSGSLSLDYFVTNLGGVKFGRTSGGTRSMEESSFIAIGSSDGASWTSSSCDWTSESRSSSIPSGTASTSHATPLTAPRAGVRAMIFDSVQLAHKRTENDFSISVEGISKSSFVNSSSAYSSSAYSSSLPSSHEPAEEALSEPPRRLQMSESQQLVSNGTEAANLAMYEQKIALLPWWRLAPPLNADLGLCDTEEWCTDTALFLLKDKVEAQTTTILMKEAEFQNNPKIKAQLAPLGSGVAFYSSHLGGIVQSLSSKRESFFNTHSSGQRYEEITRGHFRRVLGRNRYLRIRMGIRIWTFFQTSADLDVYRFYLTDQGEFRLQKQLKDNTTGAPQTPVTADSGLVHRFASWCKSLYQRSAQPDKTAKTASSGSQLPLERLKVIDTSASVRNILEAPLLKKAGATAIAALWNDQSPEPLVVASDRQTDINDIIFVIRFAQHYRGLQLAKIHTD